MPPLHERFRFLGYLRGGARGAFFRIWRQAAATDDGKAIQVSGLRNLLPRRAVLPPGTSPAAKPYPDLGGPPPGPRPSERDDVILITARFRSGSTLLWNLFRNVAGCTSYYEPFNERRWFDASARGSHTDPTHRGVDDYWREYEGLSDLGQYYRESWTEQDLFMDADAWGPSMKRYVEVMIEKAPGRPVLQFNRIDFRLPWFRRHFPRAKLVHLYRHPRDQWCSGFADLKAVPRELTAAEFARFDHYYLRNWARDLKYHFPFLDERSAGHPYRMFYFVWKLSFLFGRSYAHVSLAFEDLCASPLPRLTELFRELNLTSTPPEKLLPLVEKPRSGRWRDYAPEEWFKEHETACEAVLSDFFGGP